MRYTAQRPVGDDGAPILGPDGRPIIIPHFQIPGFVVFDRAVDAQALGAYAFLCSFLDPSEGEVSSSVTAADIARRFGVTEQVVSRRGGRKGNPPGLVPRLAQAGALMVGPSRVKVRACPGCGTAALEPCPQECAETRGRRSVKPRFQLTQAPPQGFLYPGPLDRWEYRQPKGIAKRLRQEGPDSTTPVEERRDQIPFVQALAWPALDPEMSLRHLGVYVFLAAHSDLSRSRVTTGDWLFRETIADRFDLSVSRVSQITRELEEARYIAKQGLLHRAGRRHGVTGEPVSYAIRVMPPGGLVYPKPLRLSEFRDPARITARQEAVRKDPTMRLQFPHTPSELGIVDNQSYPQEGGRGNERLWMCDQEAVDVETGDLRTHPHTHPRTHPSPSVPQPQPQGGADPGPVGGGADGVEFSRGGGAGQTDGPPAAAAADPLWPLVTRHVPAGACRDGLQDQLKILSLLQQLRANGYGDARLKLVFQGLGSDSVLNPWGVVYSRVSSRAHLERHLGVLDEIEADKREREQRSQGRGRCGVHGLPAVPELSSPWVPRCVRCHKEEQEMFGSPAGVKASTADGEGPAGAEEVEDLTPNRLSEALNEASTAARRQQQLLAAVGGPRQAQSPVRPGQTFEDLGLVVGSEWTVDHCGRCIPEGRYLTFEVSPQKYSRVACHTCHR